MRCEYWAYYYTEPTMKTDPIERYFKTRKQAMKWYEENKHIGYEWFVAKVDAEELPNDIIIVRVSKHFTCVKYGVLYDTYDCTKDETRCVYGYWIKKSD